MKAKVSDEILKQVIGQNWNQKDRQGERDVEERK